MKKKKKKYFFFFFFFFFKKIRHGVDKENVIGETPLFNVCKDGNENIFNYLVKHGADINKVNNYGNREDS